eukprot:1417327-Pyramimonas_sp.AAC.1
MGRSVLIDSGARAALPTFVCEMRGRELPGMLIQGPARHAFRHHLRVSALKIELHCAWALRRRRGKRLPASVKERGCGSRRRP